MTAMNDEERKERAVEILTEESAEPLAWWWLSFCDPHLPEGSQFLGACLVKAHGFLGATFVARTLGCNPGGEVRGAGPIPIDAMIQPGWTERLLTRAEAEEFDRVHKGS
jgi:hypothetical protein